MGELALLLALPIIAAGLVVTVPSRRWSPRFVTLLVLAAQVGVAGWFATRVLGSLGLRQVMGGFRVPFGIEVVLDGVSMLVVLLIAVVAFAIVWTIQSEARSSGFYGLVLLLVAGLTGVAIAGDVFNLYVFLEISGLAAYGLVASGRGGKGALSALKYLIVGTVGATLYLLGVAYLYVVTGTLNMGDLSARLPEVAGYGSPAVLAGFVLIVVGLAVKVAIFPMHVWQPDAYADAPDDVTAVMAALVSTTAAYALLRVVLDVFTVSFLLANPLLHDAVLIAAAVSVIVGGLFAYRQEDVKRMLAYSSVSQFGLVTVGLLLATDTAVFGALLHLVGHAVMKAGLFLAVGVISLTAGVRTVEGYAGLAKRSPALAGGFGVLALALVGVPPAVGFVGKWYIALGAIEAGSWSMLVVIMVSTLITLAYVARLLERMFMRDPGGEEAAGAPGLVTLNPTSVSVIAAALGAIALGLAGPWLGGLVEPAIEVLMGS